MSENENLPAMPATPMELLARAVEQKVTPETLEHLLALQERYEQNQARKAYAKAVAAARSHIGPIAKSGVVRMGTGRPAYNHATLDDIDRAVVPALSKEGLFYRFNTKVPENKPEWVIVTCHIEHRDGHYEENSLAGPADASGAKNPLQAIGSAVTYLCRYTLMAALGLSASDDADANEPTERISEQQVAQLRERIMQAGQTEQRVCAYYKIKQLEDLPADLLENALKKLALQREA
jgi:ERF superfamily